MSFNKYTFIPFPPLHVSAFANKRFDYICYPFAKQHPYSIVFDSFHFIPAQLSSLVVNYCNPVFS